MTEGENSRGRKKQMELLGSNSESRTVGSVLPSPHWEDRALRTIAKALSPGRGLQEEPSLSTPGQG